MQQTHYPANAEEGSHETTKTVDPVLNPLPLGTFSNQAQHDTREQRKQNGNFKMIQVDFHVRRLLLLLSCDLIRVHHGQDIQ